MLLRDITTVNILNPSMFKINSPGCLRHAVSSVCVCQDRVISGLYTRQSLQKCMPLFTGDGVTSLTVQLSVITAWRKGKANVCKELHEDYLKAVMDNPGHEGPIWLLKQNKTKKLTRRLDKNTD